MSHAATATDISEQQSLLVRQAKAELNFPEKAKEPTKETSYKEKINYLEKIKREASLGHPEDPAIFIGDLMWFIANGNEPSQLWLIKRLQQNPPFETPLLAKAEEEILKKLKASPKSPEREVRRRVESEFLPFLAETLGAAAKPALAPRVKEIGLYRILAKPYALEKLELDLEIKYCYPASTVVLATVETIEAIKKRFPTENLKVAPEVINAKLRWDRPAPDPQPLVPPPAEEVKMKEIYVIKFVAPTLDSWFERAQASGLKFLQPLGNFTYVIEAQDRAGLAEFEKFEAVAEIYPYQPKIEVHPEYLDILSRRKNGHSPTAEDIQKDKFALKKLARIGVLAPGLMTLTFFIPEDCSRAEEDLRRHGVTIIESCDDAELTIDLTFHDNAPIHWEIVLQQPGLRRVEQHQVATIFNSIASRVLWDGQVSPSINPDIALTGKGEIIAIADTGLDTGDRQDIHPDFSGRVKTIESYPISSFDSEHFENVGADSGSADRYSGHGTHVAGSALGDGSLSASKNLPEQVQGVAPQAELIFQAMEQTPVYKQALKDLHGPENLPISGLFGLPPKLSELFNFAYERDARIHSNSWGLKWPHTDKTRLAEQLDEFVWLHKDFLVIVAAGNEGWHNLPIHGITLDNDNSCIDETALGNDNSPIDGIALGNVCAPGTAKNCLTVGACESWRPQFTKTYSQHNPELFQFKPFCDDPMADSFDDIVAFSSRGPCGPDKRRKPDLVAPGTYILSTRSSQMPTDQFEWGAYDPAKEHYMYNGGTSMATPLIAGCAALVRQYLRESQGMDKPCAALVKAILIHSAEYMNYRYAHSTSRPPADYEQGWGRINLKSCLFPDDPSKKTLFIDQDKKLKASSERYYYSIKVEAGNAPLRVTLVYTDLPGEKLVNNLNLIVYSPDGKYFRGNDFEDKDEPDEANNVEGIIRWSPDPGIWRIEIDAKELTPYLFPQDTELGEGNIYPQDYALVISGSGLTLLDQGYVYS